MPMGIVSNEEFEKELRDSHVKESTIPAGNVTIIERGRGPNPEVPDSLRKIIGDMSVVDGRQEALKFAETFDISSSSVSAYANGSTSTRTYDKQPNIGVINEALGRIRKKAANKINKALNEITDDKLKVTSAKDLSTIAKDMSAIVKNLEPPKNADDPDKKDKPQFIVFAPQIRDERTFEIVHVKE